MVVSLTGQYPDAQAVMIEVAGESVESGHDATLIALAEHEAYEPAVRRGHAGKWETSFMLYLYPELVDTEEIDAHPQEPFRGVRETPNSLEASAEIGREMTTVIVEMLAGRVEAALEE